MIKKSDIDRNWSDSPTYTVTTLVTVKDYSIIEGMPTEVNQRVKSLLDTGWSLNGPLIPIVHDGKTIVAQGMVKHEV